MNSQQKKKPSLILGILSIVLGLHREGQVYPTKGCKA